MALYNATPPTQIEDRPLLCNSPFTFMRDEGSPGQDKARRRHVSHQWPRLGLDPFVHLTALEEAEIIPGKDSDTRIKPLALTNGHGRYMTVTPERTLASVGECPLNI